MHFLSFSSKLGADPAFSFSYFLGGGGGGAQMIIISMRARTSQARKPKPLTAGVQGPLQALGVIDALSWYLSVIFKHSDTKWD